MQAPLPNPIAKTHPGLHQALAQLTEQANNKGFAQRDEIPRLHQQVERVISLLRQQTRLA